MSGVLGAAAVMLVVLGTQQGCKCPFAGKSGEAVKKSRLLVELPESCNTPDGMCLLADNSVVVSIPNFNDSKQPPLLVKITPDNEERGTAFQAH